MNPLPVLFLKTVLFPAGRMSLHLTDPNLRQLALDSIQTQHPVGICLSLQESNLPDGEEAGLHLTGTEAQIITHREVNTNTLSVELGGLRRFRIQHKILRTNNIAEASVCWLPEPQCSIPPALADLLPLLIAMLSEAGITLPPPEQFTDAAWVGARYSEMLPIPLRARQKLLELDDVIGRLEIIQQFLRQHNLLTQLPQG